MENYPFSEKKRTIWKHFIRQFQEESVASYQSDFLEFTRFTKKDFLDIRAEDVSAFYRNLETKMDEKVLAPSTCAKKIRELNSLSNYIYENRLEFGISDDYTNHFADYVKKVQKVSTYANAVPVEDIDRLLVAAQENHMAYCIIILLYRMGFSSTEIVNMKPENIRLYNNGAYAFMPKRDKANFIPEDVYKILDLYLAERESNEYLFYNKYGNQLNTMYISRMLKKYTSKAGIHNYSAQQLRNSCIYTMFAYGADTERVAEEMGITSDNLKRYKRNYIDETSRSLRSMVKLKADLPENE